MNPRPKVALHHQRAQVLRATVVHWAERPEEVWASFGSLHGAGYACLAFLRDLFQRLG